jgi:hypothetical protein
MLKNPRLWCEYKLFYLWQTLFRTLFSNFSKFEVQIWSSVVVILPKFGSSSKFGRSKFSRWWSSPTELPICVHIFLSTFFKVWSSDSKFSRHPPLSNNQTSIDPAWGGCDDWTSRKWDGPPPTWKIHQWNHNIWSRVIIFGVQSFGVQIRC